MSGPSARGPATRGAGVLDRHQADVLAAAKLWLTCPASPGTSMGDMPYLSTALYSLVVVPTDQVATMAVDAAWRLYVNVHWLGTCAEDIPRVGRGLAHHVWHLLAEHSGRALDIGVRPATAAAWQVATDVTVHEVVGHLPQAQSIGPATGARACEPHTRAGAPHEPRSARELGLPPGRSAEEYFAILTGLPVDDGSGDPGDAGWSAGGPPGPDPSCGSGCDGLPRAYELPARTDAGVTQAQADMIRQAVAIEYRDSLRGRGSVPGDWERWVAGILDPVVDWRTVLHAAVRRGIGWAHGHATYTYSRISRRQSASARVILPGLRRPVPRVAVVVDTSGSVDDGLLAQALGEVDGVLSALGVGDRQVTVLAVDAGVQAVTRVRHARDVVLAGGGGTDMAVGIRSAQEVRPRVDVVIVLTDGVTGWPERPAAIPVVGVLIGRSRAELPATPDWLLRVECVP